MLFSVFTLYGRLLFHNVNSLSYVHILGWCMYNSKACTVYLVRYVHTLCVPIVWASSACVHAHVMGMSFVYVRIRVHVCINKKVQILYMCIFICSYVFVCAQIHGFTRGHAAFRQQGFLQLNSDLSTCEKPACQSLSKKFFCIRPLPTMFGWTWQTSLRLPVALMVT